MDPDLKYKILTDLQLIIDSYSGNLTYPDIIKLKSSQTNDPLWNPSYNTLADMRKAKMYLSEQEIESLGNHQETDKRWSKPRKTASLTSDANNTI